MGFLINQTFRATVVRRYALNEGEHPGLDYSHASLIVAEGGKAEDKT